MTTETPNTDPAEVARLVGDEGGRWEITTSHGTRHILDLDVVLPTVTRVPAPGREWSARDLQHFESERRKDGAAVPIRELHQCQVGSCMRILEGVETEFAIGWRITSPIVSIRRLDSEAPETAGGVGEGAPGS